MRKPTFNNIPNKSYNINGKEIWHSRSPAVVAVIMAIDKNINNKYILIEKRSDIMPMEPGKWALPGGCIDWNENGWNALRREVYEETSFLIDTYKDYMIYNNNKEPFFVETEPSKSSQMIILNYALYFFFNKEYFPNYVENYSNEEVTKVKWAKLDEVLSKKYNMAFEHEEIVKIGVNSFLRGTLNLMIYK